jgi:hypothetical protein
MRQLQRLAVLSILCGAMSGAAWGQAASAAASGTFFPGPETLKARAAGTNVAPQHISFPGAGGSVSTEIVTEQTQSSDPATLPLWSFNVLAARDGQRHRGVQVGTDPFTNPGSASVPVRIVPIRFVLHNVATAFDPNTFAISTQPAHYVIDPTDRDRACMGNSNNVPAIVLRQSPIFEPTNFSFGPTALGNVQYVDAHQRASFYNANGNVAGNYHLILDPAILSDAITLDVPAYAGLAIDPNVAQIFNTAFGFNFCGLSAIVDINWFDEHVNDVLLPHLAGAGVDPTNLPYFLVYNTWMAAPVTFFGSCCIGGYHSNGFAGRSPTVPSQTYAVANFDSTGIFGPGALDSAIAAHEIGEWANDPYGINLVPPWGGTGQVAGCQSNLEVGDPLTGTTMPNVTGANGFTYHLQELAFFSWFFGAPSVGANGWFSGNGTFKTDAGTPCAYF